MLFMKDMELVLVVGVVVVGLKRIAGDKTFVCLFPHVAYGRLAAMAYIQPNSWPPGRGQLMRLPHPLP
jgi:hypothetical protein